MRFEPHLKGAGKALPQLLAASLAAALLLPALAHAQADTTAGRAKAEAACAACHGLTRSM